MEASRKLCELTVNATALAANFDSLLVASEGSKQRLDDAILGEEFRHRFCASWTPEILNRDLQTMRWLAECNKRMLFHNMELRAGLRAKLLSAVKLRLAGTSNPAEIQCLLEIALKSVFYGTPGEGHGVVPRDGGDEIIDLFKDYVGHQDSMIHEFAREQLRIMAARWTSRYEEIRQFLIEKAPEIHQYLTAERIRGVPFDTVTGTEIGGCAEMNWLAVERATPDKLAAIIAQELYSERSHDALAFKALKVLQQRALGDNGEGAVESLAELIRGGIQPAKLLRGFVVAASEEQFPDGAHTTSQRLNQLLDAYRDAAQQNWSQSNADPVQVLTSIKDSLRATREKSAKTAVPPEAVEVSLRVEQQLADAAKRMEGIKIKMGEKRLRPPHQDVSRLLSE